MRMCAHRMFFAERISAILLHFAEYAVFLFSVYVCIFGCECIRHKCAYICGLLYALKLFRAHTDDKSRRIESNPNKIQFHCAVKGK